MPMSQTSQAGGTRPLFDLCAGHPVLDFVNTADDRFQGKGPVERLVDYADLLRFAEQAGVIDPRQGRLLGGSVRSRAAARALRSARQLREALASALYAVSDGKAPAPAVLLTLQRHFHSASRHRRLRREAAGLGWHWGRFDSHAELPVWILSLAARELLTSGPMERVRACAAENCRWLFLDTSRNHTRRWCKMEVCGNRTKARRFQERHT